MSDEGRPPTIPPLPGDDGPWAASDPKPERKARQTGAHRKRATVRIPDDRVPDTRPSSPRAVAAASAQVTSSPRGPVAPASEGLPPTRKATIASAPRSAPRSERVIADEKSIFVVRPIDIVSDMPPVPSASRPRIASLDDDAPVDLEPDRMSLPGDFVNAALRTAVRPPPLPARIPAVEPAPSSTPPSTARTGEPPPPPARPVTTPPAEAAPPAAAAAPTAPQPPVPAKRKRAAAVEAPPAAAAPTAPRPWWSEMFEDDLARTIDTPNAKDLQREVAFVEQSLRLPAGSRVLDLACGLGMHAVELAARGYDVVAVDLSTTMLRHAREYAAQRKQQPTFVQGDMRQLDIEAGFDGIYCWSASFGYFDDATNVNILERMIRALKPGGRLLLDLANRDYIAPRSPSTAWFARPGCVCMDEARYDYFSSRLNAKRMAIFENGRAREVEYSVRLYTAHELGILLMKLGLKVLEVSGHRAHRGAYFGGESPRLIMLAQKA